MKIGDIIENPFVSPTWSDGTVNPLHHTMVISKNTDHVKVLDYNGEIHSFEARRTSTWKVVKHVDFKSLVNG